MLVLGGRSSLGNNEIGSLQDIDQLDLYKSITKWSHVCHEARRIPEYVAMAFRHALSGRPGPVYLELPQDILMSRVEKSKARFPENYRAKINRGAVPCHPLRVAEEIRDFGGQDARYVIDGGFTSVWSMGVLPDGRRMGVYVIPIDRARNRKHRRWRYEIRGRIEWRGVIEDSTATTSSR